ncbi:MAG: hypothetical protein KJ749_05355 [Planctomycetes bacterium]|nr:hypothetical protein [Planctomycetota bacterium]
MPVLQANLDLPTGAAVVAVLAPLVAVPLTMVIFHLRSMREHQAARQDDFARRLELLDEALACVRQRMMELPRETTTNEEWLRESMAARHHLERLSAAVTRLETELEVLRRAAGGGQLQTAADPAPAEGAKLTVAPTRTHLAEQG